MSFIDTPDSYSYRWYLRPLPFLLRHQSGGLTEPVRLWGCVPAVFPGFLWMLRALERRASPLNPQPAAPASRKSTSTPSASTSTAAGRWNWG